MPKTYLIVGATRGIGLEFTSQLLSAGHIVIATSRSPLSSHPSSLPINPIQSLPPLPSPLSPLLTSQPSPAAANPNPSTASKLLALSSGPHGHNLTILECDVSDENSIRRFSEEVGQLAREGEVLEGGVIDCVVVHAGVLEYPGRVGEISFSSFAYHLHTNAIGPLLTASALLSLSSPPSSPSSSSQRPHPAHSSTLSPSHSDYALPPPIAPLPPTTTATQSFAPIIIKTLVFISSDSGSVARFRSFEDGFGAYAASKAALNMGLRHLAAEVHRTTNPSTQSTSTSAPQDAVSNIQSPKTVFLALHPGEVSTDMAANVSLGWEVEGIITPEESVRCMLKVIEEKGYGGLDEGGVKSAEAEKREIEDGEASFWTWLGERYPW